MVEVSCKCRRRVLISVSSFLNVLLYMISCSRVLSKTLGRVDINRGPKLDWLA